MIPISLLRLITTTFFHPSEIWKAIELNKRKTTFLFLLICFFVSIPYFISGLSQFSLMANDMERIESHLPAFIIEDGQIIFEEPLDKAIVAKTDFVNLIIDTNDQYEDRLEQKDIQNTPINLLFSKEHVSFYATGIPITFAYTDLNGLTDNFLRTILLQFSNTTVVLILTMIVFSFITGTFEAEFHLFYFTLLANLLSAFMKVRLPFSINWKMIMLASAVPFLLFSVMNSFSIQPGGQTYILLTIVLYMYYKGVKSYLKNIT